jgi:hypothetical protein
MIFKIFNAQCSMFNFFDKQELQNVRHCEDDSSKQSRNVLCDNKF